MCLKCLSSPTLTYNFKPFYIKKKFGGLPIFLLGAKSLGPSVQKIL